MASSNQTTPVPSDNPPRAPESLERDAEPSQAERAPHEPRPPPASQQMGRPRQPGVRPASGGKLPESATPAPKEEGVASHGSQDIPEEPGADVQPHGVQMAPADAAMMQHIEVAVEKHLAGAWFDEALARHMLKASERFTVASEYAKDIVGGVVPLGELEAREAALEERLQQRLQQQFDVAARQPHHAAGAAHPQQDQLESLSNRLAIVEHGLATSSGSAPRNTEADAVEVGTDTGRSLAELGSRVDKIQSALDELKKSVSINKESLRELRPLQQNVEKVLQLLDPIDRKVSAAEKAAAQIDAKKIESLVQKKYAEQQAAIEDLQKRVQELHSLQNQAVPREGAPPLPEGDDLEAMMQKQITVRMQSQESIVLQPMRKQLQIIEKAVKESTAAQAAQHAEIEKTLEIRLQSLHDVHKKSPGQQERTPGVDVEAFVQRQVAIKMQDVENTVLQPIKKELQMLGKAVKESKTHRGSEQIVEQRISENNTQLVEALSAELQQRLEKYDEALDGALKERLASINKEATGNIDRVQDHVQPLREQLEELQCSKVGKTELHSIHERIAATEKLHDRIIADQKAMMHQQKQQLAEQMEHMLHVVQKQSTGEAARAIGANSVASTELPNSRPGTAPAPTPGPFTSMQSLQSPVQQKASWNSANFNSVSPTPEVEGALTFAHSHLEQELVEKVMEREPDRQAVGMSHFVLRDMANSVVREIVGIFESLLDRLLLEKKHDVIRCMVAELLTEDLASTIATGHEQLKKKEFGHILKELERLRAELRDSENVWQDKFALVQEFQVHQEEMWMKCDERFQRLEAGMGRLENETVSHEQLKEHLDTVAKEFDDAKNRIAKSEGLIIERAEQLSDMRGHLEKHYALKDDVSQAEKRLTGEINTTNDRHARGLQELEEQTARRFEHNDLRSEHEIVSQALRQQINEATARIGDVTMQLSDFQRAVDDTYVKREIHDKDITTLTDKKEVLQERFDQEIRTLHAVAATKHSLADGHNALQRSINAVETKLQSTDNGLLHTATEVHALQDLSKSLASREFVWEEATKIAQKVALECDEKEEIGQLRREFDMERERLRQTVRQQQHARKDINDTIEEMHDLRVRTTSLTKSADALKEQVDRLDEREVNGDMQVRQLIHHREQAHNDLKQAFEKLRCDHHEFATWTKSESERLKIHSTQRYLEQIDRALNMNSTLQAIKGEHDDLKTKLPRVS